MGSHEALRAEGTQHIKEDFCRPSFFVHVYSCVYSFAYKYHSYIGKFLNIYVFIYRRILLFICE